MTGCLWISDNTKPAAHEKIQLERLFLLLKERAQSGHSNCIDCRLGNLCCIVIQAKDEDKYVTTKFDNELSDSVATLEQKKETTPNAAKPFFKNEINENDLFAFDPNTLDEAGEKAWTK